MQAHASVIIPAHDEAGAIRRLLTMIRGVAPMMDVVVVANGCTDTTVETVRSFPEVGLIELEVASKIAALNAGDAVARYPARIYLDADVSIAPETLTALAHRLEGAPPIVASPAVFVDSTGSSLFARAYQRIWALTDYRRNGHTGSGVYGMSAAGRSRFEAFPEVIADDLFVHRLFRDGERIVTPGNPFTIHAPRTLRAQIGRLRRTMAGEMQLHRMFPDLERHSGARRRLFGRVARRPLLWPSFVVYSYAYAAGRLSARHKLRSGAIGVWERDITSRAA